MLRTWGESGAIGSGITVLAMSNRFWRMQIVSTWLVLDVRLQEM